MKKIKIALVILNWNNVKDTIDCINSIEDSNYNDYKIFCLDNGSKKNDYSILIKKFKKNKKIKFFKSNRNLGFAGGNNFICSKISLNDFDYVLLLNNDTIIKKDFFDKINLAIKNLNDKKIGMLVPTIYYHNKLLKEDKIWRADDFGKISNKNKEIKHPVGCAMFIKSKLIKDYGLFNENFFAYGEEVEYAYRLRKKGIKIYYVPQAVIWHKVIEAEDSLFKIYMMSRNKWYYWEKRSTADKIIYLPYLLFVYNIKKLLKYSFKLTNIKIFFKGNIDGIKWIFTNKKPKNPFIKNE